MPPPKICPSPGPLEPRKGTLFGNRVSVDVINIRISRRAHPGFGVGPKSSDKIPYRKSIRSTETQREEGRVKVEAETGEVLPPAKEHQRARRGLGPGSPSEPAEGTPGAHHLIAGF